MDHTVDVSKRVKDYTCAVKAEHLPENEESIIRYLQMVKYLQERSDIAFDIELVGWEDPREIRVTWSGEDYYVELDYPSVYLEGVTVLRLAGDGYTFEEVCAILRSIMIEHLPAHKIGLLRERVADVTKSVSIGKDTSQ